VNSADSALYLDSGSSISVVAAGCPPPDHECRFVETFGAPALSGGAGLTVDSQSAAVYAADTSSQRIDVFVLAPPSAPGIEDEFVSNVTADSVSFSASVRPNGSGTSYHVEYGPCATPATCASSGYGSSVPVPDAFVGSDFGIYPVGPAHAGGFLAGTTYHYRVVAKNSSGVSTGLEQAFTTQTVSEAGLPDNREWEQVSPTQKFGAPILPANGPEVTVQAAAAGSAITYAASAPTEANPQGNSNYAQVLSARGSTGWSSQDLATPHTVTTGRGEAEYTLFSSDLSTATLLPDGAFEPVLSSAASEQTPYLRTNFPGGDVGHPCGSSCYAPLVTGCPPVGHACEPSIAEHANVPPGTAFGFNLNVRGATPDMSHVVIESQVALTGAPVPVEKSGLYEWAAGRLTFVGVGSSTNDQTKAVFQGVSDDGSRVVFNGESEGQKGLLVRDTVLGKTARLDAVEPGCGTVSGEAECVAGTAVFQGMSSDGSRLFFTDDGRLTKDSGATEKKPDLYECAVVMVGEVVGCSLSDFTPSGVGGESAGVLGRVLGMSRDGSAVYFAANGVLAAGAVHGACDSITVDRNAECNLYALHYDGVSWVSPRLIAVLNQGDSPDWRPELASHSSRVSNNGEWLAFQSQLGLTGYDSHDAVTGERDQEVYLYNGVSGVLVCASCNPTGARPVGVEAEGMEGFAVPGAHTWGRERVAATVPVWTQYQTGSSLYQPRYLSDSGRLFFDSPDRLVPGAVNHVEDVFEYEPLGVGGCSAGVVGQGVVFFGGAGAPFNAGGAGCVGLLSSGGAVGESAFLDASEDGGDAFFLTSAKLTASDKDSSLDVYDAHACSVGSPCLPAGSVVPPPCGTGDACKAAPSPQPSIFGAPASSTFSGSGNAASGTTSKGAVRPLTRAQKLARAVRVCHKRYPHSKTRRHACERQAHKRYGPPRKSKKASHTTTTRKGGK
jgi:hypothetical protein